MTELSLYVLDIVQNSITADASRIDVNLVERLGTLTFEVKDNGRGMSAEMAEKVTDPFTTSRTTRRVGLGLPFLKLAAEQTGGSLELSSELGVGTSLSALFQTEHIDMVPLGDFAGTVVTLIQGAPDIRFVIKRGRDDKEYTLDTDELREVLGGDVPLNEPDVLTWINDYVTENELSL
ncbi:MAG: ATP-binding protein [Oscillospiraceae bacterium]|nr:ATP-binding protein [Oscillospiraceae bacterium]